MEIIKKSIYFLIVLLFVFFVESPLWLAASSILCSLVATAVNTFPNRRLLNYGYLQLLKDIFPNLIPAIIMCGVVYLMNFLEINLFLLLVTQVAVGVCVYIVLTLITKNESLLYVFDLVKSIFKGNKNENS